MFIILFHVMLLYIALYPVGIVSSVLTGKYCFRSKREKILILKNVFLPTYNLVPLTVSVVSPIKKILKKLKKKADKSIESGKQCFMEWYLG